MAELGAALVDLDGVLCDAGHREGFAAEERWEDFHSRCPADPPLAAECALVRAWAAAGGEVIYCTARLVAYKADTVLWLGRHGLPKGQLFMRGADDRRPSVELKRSVLDTLLATGKRIEFALDDNDSVVRMYRERGVTCLQPRSEGQALNGDGASHPAAPLIRQAEKTYKERRAAYGPSEQLFGSVMAALFPGGVQLKEQRDWVRFGLLTQVVGKLCRYARDPLRGHVDSAHDLGVYAFMLEAEDRKP